MPTQRYHIQGIWYLAMFLYGLPFLTMIVAFGWKGIAELILYAILILPFVCKKGKGWTPSEKFLIDPDLAISEGEKQTEVHKTHDPRW